MGIAFLLMVVFFGIVDFIAFCLMVVSVAALVVSIVLSIKNKWRKGCTVLAILGSIGTLIFLPSFIGLVILTVEAFQSLFTSIVWITILGGMAYLFRKSCEMYYIFQPIFFNLKFHYFRLWITKIIQPQISLSQKKKSISNTTLQIWRVVQRKDDF